MPICDAANAETASGPAPIDEADDGRDEGGDFWPKLQHAFEVLRVGHRVELAAKFVSGFAARIPPAE
jgi:hypothetical protein